MPSHGPPCPLFLGTPHAPFGWEPPSPPSWDNYSNDSSISLINADGTLYNVSVSAGVAIDCHASWVLVVLLLNVVWYLPL